MNPSRHVLNLSEHWYRRITCLYWLIVIFVLLIESVPLFLMPEQRVQIIRSNLLLQGALLAACLLLLEVASLRPKLRTDYSLVTACSGLVIIFAGFHQDVISIPVILLSPLLIAILSFKRNLIVYASILIGLSFCGSLFIFDLSITKHPGSLFTLMGFSLTMMLCSYMTVSRGAAILENLNSAHSAHQELLVKNIIMDKLFKLDALTELYNHKTFHEYLDKLIEQSEDNSLPLQLAIVDLDDFKKVNDTFGHRVGDNVLMRTAQLLRQAVTPNDFVARYGGEEFTIIFTEKTLTQSCSMLERILGEMRQLEHEELGFKAVTCSIGVENYKRGMGKEHLFAMADTSLYTAKRRGKNQLYCSELSAEAKPSR